MSRNKRIAKEWRALIAEQQESRQLQEEWCIAKGVNLYTYRDRVCRMKKIDSEGLKRDVMFIQTKHRKKNESACTVLPKTEQTTWVEIKPEVVEQKEIACRCNGKLIIEVGVLRITADALYPVSVLASFLQEVTKPC